MLVFRNWVTGKISPVANLLIFTALGIWPAFGMAEPQALPKGYTVTNIGDFGITIGRKSFNASGQIAGYAHFPGIDEPHAAFYDGKTVRDLGTLGDPQAESIGRVINDSGQIAGSSELAPEGRSDSVAFVFDGKVMWNLGVLPGGQPSSEAYAINNAGQVAGTSSSALGFHAFFYDGTRMIDLGTFENGSGYSSASDMNDRGQVVGHALKAENPQAFIYDQGALKDVVPRANKLRWSYATAISPSGYVTGSALFGSDFDYHPFLYDGTSAKDLGVLPNRAGSVYGTMINAANQVAGVSIDDQGYHGFFYDGASMRDIGAFTTGKEWDHPVSMNDHGHLAGYSIANITEPDEVRRGFVWSPEEGLVDLNTRLVDPPPGLWVRRAFAINNAGMILADSDAGMLVLTPMSPGPPPAPPALAPISANDPVPVGTPAQLTAQFTDPNASDTHTAVWTWQDQETTAGMVSESNGSGTVTGSRTFRRAGIYTVQLTVTDSGGLQGQTSRTVIVYDPSAGFATGGGWFESLPGAYPANRQVEGRAHFAFVAKYHGKGRKNPRPDGQVTFRLEDTPFSFKTRDIDWIVVADNTVRIGGTGRVNGRGDYMFQLDAWDAGQSGAGSGDRLRLRISHRDPGTGGEVVDYDNSLGTVDNSIFGVSLIKGGNIAIHQP